MNPDPTRKKIKRTAPAAIAKMQEESPENGPLQKSYLKKEEPASTSNKAKMFSAMLCLIMKVTLTSVKRVNSMNYLDGKKFLAVIIPLF